MITISDRNEPIGSNLPQEVKEGLRELAERLGVSMSKLMSFAVTKKLRELGYNVQLEILQ